MYHSGVTDLAVSHARRSSAEHCHHGAVPDVLPLLHRAQLSLPLLSRPRSENCGAATVADAIGHVVDEQQIWRDAHDGAAGSDHRLAHSLHALEGDVCV